MTCSLPRPGLRLSSWGRQALARLSLSCPPAACCLSLRDPSCPVCCLSLRDPLRLAIRARSRSGVSTCSRGHGSLVGIVVAYTQSRMSGNRAVRVGKLRAGAPNSQPPAPITLSLRAWVPCGEAGFLCCVPTSVEFECEDVPLRRVPPWGRGASLVAALMFQSSGLPPNWPTRDRSCFRM